MIAFAVCTILACLTTAIGIVATVEDFITVRTKNKVKFNHAVLAICILDVFLASGGVTFLIQMASPIFLLLYPISIVMIICTLAKGLVPNNGAIKGGVLMAGLVGIYDAVNSLNGSEILNVHMESIEKFYSAISLSQYGFAWILPTAVGFVIGTVLGKAVKKTEMTQ